MGDAPSQGEAGRLSSAIAQRVDRLWPREDDRRRVREALLRYGSETYEPEVDRVRLAILKISDGDLESVLTNVATAKRDFRDVLMWAEYPGEAGVGWSWRADLSQADRDRLAEIRRLDREQYEEWLRSGE